MSPAKKSSKKAASPEEPSPLLERSSVLAMADMDAEARRAVAQDLVDVGYAIINAGTDEDGRHWFQGRRESDSDGEEADVKKVYVEGTSS